MQHDGPHGPAIDGGPRYLRDDSTGKDFTVLHGRPTTRWLKRSRFAVSVEPPNRHVLLPFLPKVKARPWLEQANQERAVERLGGEAAAARDQVADRQRGGGGDSVTSGVQTAKEGLGMGRDRLRSSLDRGFGQSSAGCGPPSCTRLVRPGPWHGRGGAPEHCAADRRAADPDGGAGRGPCAVVGAALPPMPCARNSRAQRSVRA